MTTLEILKRVRRRLEKPEAWTKGADARAADGRIVMFNEPSAVCWCLSGALAAESDSLAIPVSGAEDAAYASLERILSRASIPRWNDAPERTHSEVLALLDQAIAAEEK